MATLHVRSGDDIRDTLPAAGFDGEFRCYADPVCEGPVPDGDVDLVEVRARYLADPPEQPVDEVGARLRAVEARAVDRGPGGLRELFPRVQAGDPAPFQGATPGYGGPWSGSPAVITRAPRRGPGVDPDPVRAEPARRRGRPGGRAAMAGRVHLDGPAWVWDDRTGRAAPA